MDELRRSVKLYIGAVALAAAGLVLVLTMRMQIPDSGVLALALLFVVLRTAACLFPLSLLYRNMKITLGAGVAFGAVLLFDPGIAVLITLVGVSAAWILRRQSLAEIIFNSAQTTLSAGSSAVVLAALGWNLAVPPIESPQQILKIVAAGTTLYVVNTILVAVMVSLQTRRSALRLWREMNSAMWSEELAQLALGGAIAAGAYRDPWILPFLVLPTLIIHRSLERRDRLRTQTVDAVTSLAEIVDLRDPYTADHSRRVAAYSVQLGVELGLTPDQIEMVELAARVHDVGKVVIDSSILSKPGHLNDDEWEQLKRHPETGANMLSEYPTFEHAASFVLHHHERLDGGGYPHGLKGEEIPLGARIIAVADALDAMTTARPYRGPLPADSVHAAFEHDRGRQWDERVVKAFLSLVERQVITLPTTESEAPPSLPAYAARA